VYVCVDASTTGVAGPGAEQPVRHNSRADTKMLVIVRFIADIPFKILYQYTKEGDVIQVIITRKTCA
jgi:hypothetical protein